MPFRLAAHLPLVSRIVAAVLGGYALAALTSVATLALPMERGEAVLGLCGVFGAARLGRTARGERPPAAGGHGHLAGRRCLSGRSWS